MYWALYTLVSCNNYKWCSCISLWDHDIDFRVEPMLWEESRDSTRSNYTGAITPEWLQSCTRKGKNVKNFQNLDFNGAPNSPPHALKQIFGNTNHAGVLGGSLWTFSHREIQITETFFWLSSVICQQHAVKMWDICSRCGWLKGMKMKLRSECVWSVSLWIPLRTWGFRSMKFPIKKGQWECEIGLCAIQYLSSQIRFHNCSNEC